MYITIVEKIVFISIMLVGAFILTLVSFLSFSDEAYSIYCHDGVKYIRSLQSGELIVAFNPDGSLIKCE